MMLCKPSWQQANTAIMMCVIDSYNLLKDFYAVRIYVIFLIPFTTTVNLQVCLAVTLGQTKIWFI